MGRIFDAANSMRAGILPVTSRTGPRPGKFHLHLWSCAKFILAEKKLLHAEWMD